MLVRISSHIGVSALHETYDSKMSKESWHLPTLVAGVMHNIEPAHHALQQEVEWKGRGTNKQTKKNKEKSFIKNRHDCLLPGWQHHRHTQWPLMKLVNHHTKCVSWSTFTVKYFFVSRMYNFFSQLPSIEWKCRHESSNGDWKTKACKRQTTQYQYFFAFAYMDPDCDLWRFVTVQFPLRPIILRQIVELIQNPQIESIL